MCTTDVQSSASMGHLHQAFAQSVCIRHLPGIGMECLHQAPAWSICMGLFPWGIYTGHLHGVFAPCITTGHLHRTFGPGIGTEHLQQVFAWGVHTGHLHRVFAEGVSSGHQRGTSAACNYCSRGFWAAAAAAAAAQGSGWEPAEQVIKAVRNVCLHAGADTPNYAAGAGRQGGAASARSRNRV